MGSVGQDTVDEAMVLPLFGLKSQKEKRAIILADTKGHLHRMWTTGVEHKGYLGLLPTPLCFTGHCKSMICCCCITALRGSKLINSQSNSLQLGPLPVSQAQTLHNSGKREQVVLSQAGSSALVSVKEAKLRPGAEGGRKWVKSSLEQPW